MRFHVSKLYFLLTKMNCVQFFTEYNSFSHNLTCKLIQWTCIPWDGLTDFKPTVLCYLISSIRVKKRPNHGFRDGSLHEKHLAGRRMPRHTAPAERVSGSAYFCSVPSSTGSPSHFLKGLIIGLEPRQSTWLRFSRYNAVSRDEAMFWFIVSFVILSPRTDFAVIFAAIS